MVCKSVITLAALAAVTQAQNLVSIAFESTLDTYYYFRENDGSISITSEGILVEGDCDAIATAQIVYSADKGEDVLLTANCFDVYYLATSENQAITWTSCVEFPFYAALCESSASSQSSSGSSSTITEYTTGVVSSSGVTVDSTVSTSSPATTVSDDETYVLTTVTSYESNIEYLYTTYCPLTEVEANAAAATHSVVDTPDYKVVEVSVTIYATTGADGKETLVTDLVPITSEAAPSTTVVTITSCSDNKCTVIPVTTGLTVVTTTEAGQVTEYTTFCPLTSETSAAVAETSSATTATEAGSAATAAAATAASTEATTEASAGASTETSTEGVAEDSTSTTVVEQTSTVAAIATFEGVGAKTVGSLSVGLLFAAIGLLI